MRQPAQGIEGRSSRENRACPPHAFQRVVESAASEGGSRVVDEFLEAPFAVPPLFFVAARLLGALLPPLLELARFVAQPRQHSGHEHVGGIEGQEVGNGFVNAPSRSVGLRGVDCRASAAVAFPPLLALESFPRCLLKLPCLRVRRVEGDGLGRAFQCALESLACELLLGGAQELPQAFESAPFRRVLRTEIGGTLLQFQPDRRTGDRFECVLD
jgi:hypothetical protein